MPSHLPLASSHVLCSALSASLLVCPPACFPSSPQRATRTFGSPSRLLSVSPLRTSDSDLFKRTYVEWSTSSSNLSQWTDHEQLRTWVLDRIRMLQPSRVHLCDGSEEENQEMLTAMVHAGVLIPLNPKIRPNSYLARSSTSDGHTHTQTHADAHTVAQSPCTERLP